MIRALRRRGPAALGVGLAAVLIAATACGGDDGSASASGGGKIALTVNVFGNFGYQQLYKQFEAAHPNITITERGTGSDLSNYTPALTKNLAAGSGAGDVVALEEGIMIQFKAAGRRTSSTSASTAATTTRPTSCPGSSSGGQSADGKKLIGLGTDVGSMGMCYRRDLFAKAGLPTDRDAVGQALADLGRLRERRRAVQGQEHRRQVVRRGVQHVQHDPRADRGQGPRLHATSTRTTSSSSTPTRRSSRRTTGCWTMIGDGLSAGYKSFSDQWNAGFKQGTFATIACPAWMLGYIQGQAGDGNKGKWDVTTAPGGGGNWGGSWLAVPTQSKHPKEAAELVRFLTSPKGQVARVQGGQQRCRPRRWRWTTRRSRRSTNPYFNDAPVGADLRHRRQAAEAGLLRTEEPGRPGRGGEHAAGRRSRGKLKPEDAWAKAVKDAQQAARVTPGRCRRRSGPPPAPPSTRDRPHRTDRRRPREHGRHDAGRGRPPPRRRPGPPDRPAGAVRAAAQPGRHQGLAVPLHRAVLRCCSASSGSTRWSTRPGCSLHDWELASAEHPWSGLDNYRQLVTDPVFWNALGNTFGIFVLVHRAAAAAGAVPGQPAQPAAARRARSSGWR